MRYLPTTPPNPQQKKISLQIWMNWDHEKKYKFGVITRPSTYLGCNNITTFFFDPLPYPEVSDTCFIINFTSKLPNIKFPKILE